MMPAMAVPLCYYFGPFAIDCNQRRLVRGGVSVPLTPKAFDLLTILLESAGRTVTVDTLMSLLWPDNEEANDATLRQHVLMVRRALGDRIRDPRYVVTDYGKGYRFVGPVSSGPSFLSQTLIDELCGAATEFRRMRSRAGLRSALDLYHRALTIDPDSPAALGGAALCRCLIADNLRDLPRPLLEHARIQSDAALSADPGCIDALLACVKVALHADGDVAKAALLAHDAVSLAPKSLPAATLYAWTLQLQSRFRDAQVFIDQRSRAFDDTELRVYRGLGSLLERDYASADAELAAVCAERPHAFARLCLGQARFSLGDATRAIAEFDAVRLSAYDPLTDGEADVQFIAEGYALYARFRFGDVHIAEAALERLRRLSQRQFVPAAAFVLAETGRRQFAAAIAQLQRSKENGEWWYVQSHLDPFLDDLRAL